MTSVATYLTLINSKDEQTSVYIGYIKRVVCWWLAEVVNKCVKQVDTFTNKGTIKLVIQRLGSDFQ